jgi:alginate O-acetyltransferase complex protein AlgI
MIFSSVTFLFLFLPLVLAASLAAPGKYRNHVLFAASLLFYLWGEGVYILLLLFSISATYFLGRSLEQLHGRRRKIFLALGITLNLLPLFFFKYLNFTADALAPILALAGTDPWRPGPVHLPAGISFFTFQAVSYLVDVYRKVVPAEQRMLNCGLYIAMFPQLIAGPIVRYHDIARQLVRRTVNLQGFATGAERFTFGLAKKVLLADPLGVRADQIFGLPLAELSTGDAWLGAVCFSLQIYYDFSGYSDMAIGLGRMFGFNLPENFRYPYISRSIREFWRRWHISLSTWLRDYLYIPLGGSRKGTPRTLANLLIVFLLCGLWHGADWTFLAWGLWHGLFLVLERLLPGKQRSIPARAGGWLYTTLVVLIGWVIFRSPSMEAAADFLLVMAGRAANGSAGFWAGLFGDRLLSTELVAALLIAFPLHGLLRQAGEKLVAGRQGTAAAAGITAVSLGRLGLFTALLYFSLISIAAQAYPPFLYFQF